MLPLVASGFFQGTVGYSNNAMLGAMYSGAGFNSAGLEAQQGTSQQPPLPPMPPPQDPT